MGLLNKIAPTANALIIDNENKIKDLVTKNENENGQNNNSVDGNLDIEQSILKKIKN